MSIAYLRILNPGKSPINIKKIHAYLKRELEFKKILSYKRYKPSGDEDRLVVWRFNGEDTISDGEGFKIVGKRGNILYLWECPRCHNIVRKCEHPKNHKEDGYFGCSCPGTSWGFPFA